MELHSSQSPTICRHGEDDRRVDACSLRHAQTGPQHHQDKYADCSIIADKADLSTLTPTDSLVGRQALEEFIIYIT